MLEGSNDEAFYVEIKGLEDTYQAPLISETEMTSNLDCNAILLAV